MTAPDPAVVDLIATHLPTRGWSDGIEVFICMECGDEWWTAELFATHVESLVKALATKRVAELEAEVLRLQAQVASIGHVDPGTYSPRHVHPDDTVINGCIEEAECFADAMFEIAEKYGANVTNNMDRWQDGVFVRHVGEFIGDTKTAALKHLSAALEGKQS